MITASNNNNNNMLCTQHLTKDNNHYRPLPSILTDFFAYKLCDIIRTKPLPSGTCRTVPELLYFILKVTSEARISCHIAIVALIYIERCKRALPKNAIGDQDTIHRIFIASILVASKFLHGTCWGANQYISEEEDKPVWLNNSRMAEICHRFYSLEDINQLELSFLSLIKFECFVNPIEVQTYLIQHREDLLI